MVSLRPHHETAELNLFHGCSLTFLPSVCLIGCKVDMFDLKVEAVDTHRGRPSVSFARLLFVLVEHPPLGLGVICCPKPGVFSAIDGKRVWGGQVVCFGSSCGVALYQAVQEWQVWVYHPIYGPTPPPPPTCDHEVVTGTNWWGVQMVEVRLLWRGRGLANPFYIRTWM